MESENIKIKRFFHQIDWVTAQSTGRKRDRVEQQLVDALAELVIYKDMFTGFKGTTCFVDLSVFKQYDRNRALTNSQVILPLQVALQSWLISRTVTWAVMEFSANKAMRKQMQRCIKLVFILQ